MKINAINTASYLNQTKKNRVRQNVQTSLLTSSDNVTTEQIAFKGMLGKCAGGILGAGFAGLCALAAMATPAGWIAAATLIASEAGGAVVGGAIGDKITGKDEEEDKDK